MEKRRGEQPGTKKRILILCGDDSLAITATNAYVERFGEHEIRVVEEKILSLGRILTFSRRRLKRLGLFSLLGAYALYVRTFIRPGRKIEKNYRPSLVTTAISRDPAIDPFIRQFEPDAIIIGFCGLLSREFLQKVGQDIYNAHPGINPRYRGFGNIWAFRENDFSNVGYTIHKVDEGADTGERIALVPVSFAGVEFENIDRHVAGLAARRLADIVLGQAPPPIAPEFQHMESRFYGVPTLFDYYVARRNYNRHLARTEQNAGDDKT